jgi:adenosylcobinamide-GDP ribazoletransferase
MRPLLIALQFLTIVPVRLPSPPRPRESGQALLWYPVVGLFIGSILAVAMVLLRAVPPPLASALLLTLWVVLTGGLHLDGLADTADAWAGGRGDVERTLTIMKDPRAGPMGVTAIVLVLLLKFAALQTTVVAHQWPALLLAPMLGRTAMPLLLAGSAYVRADGIGAAASVQLYKPGAYLVASMSAGLALVCFRSIAATMVVVAAAVLFLGRWQALRRIGGVTGDVCGAIVEVIETAVLLAVCA